MLMALNPDNGFAMVRGRAGREGGSQEGKGRGEKWEKVETERENASKSVTVNKHLRSDGCSRLNISNEAY